MRPTLPTNSPVIIDLIAGSIETLLQSQRRNGNNYWFTGEEIAAKLHLPKHLGMTFNYAFSQLPFERFEIDGDTIRHRR